MKILWIVNTIFPEPSKALGIEPPVSGGWMYGLSENISRNKGIKLSVATTYSGKVMRKYSLDNVDYYLLPCEDRFKYDRKLETYWAELCSEFQPEIVHIHGTEFAHGLACMRKCTNLKYVVSIQGFVSVYERYYYAGISKIDILKNITLRDLIKRDTIFQGKAKFRKRGIFEKEYIERTKHVIGRTSWDLTHAKALNRRVSYHFCNESLRKTFYDAPKWSFDKCDRYTIFLSQASYPIKGIHQVLTAFALLKETYPNIKLRVGGGNIIKTTTLSDKLRQSGYGKYIKRLINENGLEENIEFLGLLTENKMIEEYLKSNIFICPSSIENSPNSLGEAQLLGVPVIAAYVGGVPDMVEDSKTGMMYRFEEVEMLAKKISDIFESKSNHSLSSSAIKAAESRHNEFTNYQTLIDIYTKIEEKNNT